LHEDAVRIGLGAGKELQRADIPPAARMDLRVAIKMEVLQEAPEKDQGAAAIEASGTKCSIGLMPHQFLKGLILLS